MVYDEYVWVWACFVVCVRMPCMYNVCIVCKSCIMYDGGGGKTTARVPCRCEKQKNVEDEEYPPPKNKGLQL